MKVLLTTDIEITNEESFREAFMETRKILLHHAKKINLNPGILIANETQCLLDSLYITSQSLGLDDVKIKERMKSFLECAAEGYLVIKILNEAMEKSDGGQRAS